MPPVVVELLSVFDKIGTIKYETQVDSSPMGDGMTVVGDYAFYSTLRLNGVISKTKNGNPLRDGGQRLQHCRPARLRLHRRAEGKPPADHGRRRPRPIVDRIAFCKNSA